MNAQWVGRMNKCAQVRIPVLMQLYDVFWNLQLLYCITASSPYRGCQNRKI